MDAAWICHRQKNQVWKIQHPRTEAGLHLTLAILGNSEIFGHAIGAAPLLKWQKGHKNLSYEFYIAPGVAILSNHFSYVHNYINNAISTPVNAMVKAQNRLVLRCQASISPYLGLSLIHFSNGRTAYPNLGINMVSLAAGIKINQLKPYRFATASYPISFPPVFRWTLEAAFGYGRTSMVEGGPHYLVRNADVALAYTLGIKAKFVMGISRELRGELLRFFANQEAFAGQEKKMAGKWMHYLGYEALFGHFSLGCRLGYYLYNPFMVRGLVYTDFTARAYLFPECLGRAFNPFLETGIKTHAARADYAHVKLGLAGHLSKR